MTETIGIESIGERLHKARLKKKATIDEVYKDTKIHPKVLAALEEDRYDEFLSPTYAKAFLKSYCRYLEVDANKILGDYDKVQSRKEPLKPMPDTRGEHKYPLFLKVNWTQYTDLAKKWAVPAAVGIAGLFLGIYLIVLASKVILKVKNIKFSKAKVTAVAAKPKPSITKPLTIAQGQPLSLIVRAKGDVWLEVKADGKTVFKSVLRKGSVETYKADEKFQLWTGKGEFLELVLNGNKLGSPGNGVIRSVNLTREGLTIENK